MARREAPAVPRAATWTARLTFCDALEAYRVSTVGVYREPWGTFVTVDETGPMLERLPRAVRSMIALGMRLARFEPHRTVDVGPVNVVS